MEGEKERQALNLHLSLPGKCGKTMPKENLDKEAEGPEFFAD